MPDYKHLTASDIARQELERLGGSNSMASLALSQMAASARQIAGMEDAASAVRALEEQGMLASARQAAEMEAARSLRRQFEAVDPMRQFFESLAPKSMFENPLEAYRRGQKEAFDRSMEAWIGPTKGSVDRFLQAAGLSSAQDPRIAAGLGIPEAGMTAKQLMESFASSAFASLAGVTSAAQVARLDDIAGSVQQLKTQFEVPEFLKHLLDDVEEASRHASAGAMRLDPSAVAEEETQRQATAALGTLVENTNRQASAYELLAAILAAVKAMPRDSKVQTLLLLVVLPVVLMLVASILNPVADFYVKRALERAHSPQQATKVIKESARDAVDDVRLLSEHRFVSIGQGKTLGVHSSVGAKAPVIGQLRFGQVVRVVEKSKDFTLVEWHSQDGSASLKGWVFSRYLSRFY